MVTPPTITHADLATLQVQIDLINTRLMGQADALCTAERPHPNRLTFQRGPNIYVCECSQVYRKNGLGGLLEVN